MTHLLWFQLIYLFLFTGLRNQNSATPMRNNNLVINHKVKHNFGKRNISLKEKILFKHLMIQRNLFQFYFSQRPNKVANGGKGSISGTSFKEAIRLVSSGIVNLHVRSHWLVVYALWSGSRSEWRHVSSFRLAYNSYGLFVAVATWWYQWTDPKYFAFVKNDAFYEFDFIPSRNLKFLLAVLIKFTMVSTLFCSNVLEKYRTIWKAFW